jgi:hypothetical protein
MINRWPGFLVVIWIGSSPTPSLPLPVSKIDRRRRHTGRLRKRDNLLTEEGGGWVPYHASALVFYKSFSTLWLVPMMAQRQCRIRKTLSSCRFYLKKFMYLRGEIPVSNRKQVQHLLRQFFSPFSCGLFFASYFTLLYLAPLRFFCVGGSRVRTANGGCIAYLWELN